jgi:hypothetical protein
MHIGRSSYGERDYAFGAEAEAKLLSLLDHLGGRTVDTQDYGPANLIALLRLQGGTCAVSIFRGLPFVGRICRASKCKQ